MGPCGGEPSFSILMVWSYGQCGGKVYALVLEKMSKKSWYSSGTTALNISNSSSRSSFPWRRVVRSSWFFVVWSETGLVVGWMFNRNVSSSPSFIINLNVAVLMMLTWGGVCLGGGESCGVFENGSPSSKNVSTVGVHRWVGGRIFLDAIFGKVVPICIRFLAPGEVNGTMGEDSEDSREKFSFGFVQRSIGSPPCQTSVHNQKDLE